MHALSKNRTTRGRFDTTPSVNDSNAKREKEKKKEENEGRTVDKASAAHCTVSNNGDLQSVAKDRVIARVPSGEVQMKFPPAGTQDCLHSTIQP